jgi:hypothetical protein
MIACFVSGKKRKEKTFILRFPKHPEKKRKGRKQNNKK